MTGMALYAGASVGWTALAAVADAAIIAGTAISANASYQQGKAAEQAAAAQAEQAKAQASMYYAQQAEAERLAQVENEKAGIAQLQGEQEAAYRSRALAAEVGSIYAGYAGNGLLVDTNGSDTFGKVLSSARTEANADIDVINRNAAVTAWEHISNMRGYLAEASIYKAGGDNALVSAGNSLIAGANAAKIGELNALGTAIQGAGTLAGATFSSYGTFSKIASGSQWLNATDATGAGFSNLA